MALEISTNQTCNVCPGPSSFGASASSSTSIALSTKTESATIRCNVRAFTDEQFPVWRCPSCHSIHAGQEVDLPYYYSKYPYYRQQETGITALSYDSLRRRLVRAGLRKDHRILDYGCGSGLLVRYLRKRGYEHAVGYDEYSDEHRDPALLRGRYDCIISQDVIEHTTDPQALLRTFASLAQPRALVSIGTPDAEGIDLQRPEDYVHPLHQPYHRHILSRRALIALAQELGLSVVRVYRTSFANLPWPCMNQRFALYYARCFDDTLDLGFDKPTFHRSLLAPQSFFWALFGYFFAKPTDMMVVFRTSD